MINVDSIFRSVSGDVEDGLGDDGCDLTNNGLLELITHLREAEKDAARYRWLRDDASGLEMRAPLVFNADEYGTSSTVIDGEHLDVAIDEAMQCK